MITEEKAEEIARVVSNKYKWALAVPNYQSLDLHEIYNEAFITAVQKDTPGKAWVAAERAAFHLISRKIRPDSRHTYGDADELALEYRRARTAEQARRVAGSDITMMRIDIIEALGELLDEEKKIIEYRVILEKSERQTSKLLSISRERLHKKEHALLLRLARRLSSWRKEK